MDNHHHFHLASFNKLVSLLEKLPTIGRKSAMRMAYSLSVDNPYLGLQMSEAIQNSIANTKRCGICGSLSDGEICFMCADYSRKNGQLCILSHPRDVILIESTGEFGGVYCVMEDVKTFNFDGLTRRIVKEGIKEVIFAFVPSVASDGLVIYIQDKLKNLELHFSKIANGIPLNIGFENIDNFSLARAFSARTVI